MRRMHPDRDPTLLRTGADEYDAWAERVLAIRTQELHKLYHKGGIETRLGEAIGEIQHRENTFANTIPLTLAAFLHVLIDEQVLEFARRMMLDYPQETLEGKSSSWWYDMWERFPHG